MHKASNTMRYLPKCGRNFHFHVVNPGMYDFGRGFTEPENWFTCLFTGLSIYSRPFLMVLYEGKTNLRSEYSLVPNQALYQAEPQPELIAISRTPVVARVLTSRISQPLASASNFQEDEQLAPFMSRQ